MFTTCGQKNLEFFQWLWLLTIINFIITQLLANHLFLKNISAWLLLTSKFFSEFNSMFCYHKFRMLQKGFSLLFFAWSVKWWVSLNHPRDWINNFPGIREENHSLQRNHSAIYIFPVYWRLLLSQQNLEAFVQNSFTLNFKSIPTDNCSDETKVII